VALETVAARTPEDQYFVGSVTVQESFWSLFQSSSGG
jgi:hypothetical protein